MNFQKLCYLAFFLTLLSLITPAAAMSPWLTGGIGLGSLIILVLDVIAMFEILNGGAGWLAKGLWILFILFFPIVGLLFYV